MGLPPLRLPPRLRLMPMLTMVSTDMAFPMPAMDTVLPTTDTDMPTTDTTDIPMPTTVTTTARGPLMLRLLPPLCLRTLRVRPCLRIRPPLRLWIRILRIRCDHRVEDQLVCEVGF